MEKQAKDAIAGSDDLHSAAGWDALAEDLFGLNVRGLRSIADVFVWPKRYFEAARHADWLKKYTPSVRLIFVLTALWSFLRFLWGGESSALISSVEASIAEVKTKFPDRSAAELTDEIFTVWLLALPFVYFTLHALLSLVLRIWGRGTQAPVRMRLHFAGLLPAQVLGILSIPFLAFAPVSLMGALTLVWLAFNAILYFMTYFRGMAGRLSGPQRAWRGGLYCFTVMMVDTLASLICVQIAFIWILST